MFSIFTQSDLKQYSLTALHALLREAQSELFCVPVGSLRHIIAGENIRLLQREISTRQPAIKYQPKPKPLHP